MALSWSEKLSLLKKIMIIFLVWIPVIPLKKFDSHKKLCENKNDVYRGKDVKFFCMLKRVRSTEKTNKWIAEIKFAIFAMNHLRINLLKRKNIAKLKSIVIIHENIEVLHIAYVI